MFKKIFFLILFVSCSRGPQPISYVTDVCHYCQMSIVSKPFAAQFVTKKGKVYKYDAIECLVRHHPIEGTAYINDFYTHQPIPAKQAMFLIHDSIRSPMGGNLAGFKDRTDGLTWEELYEVFR